MQDDMTQAVTDIIDNLSDIQEGLFTHSIWYTLTLAVIVGLVAFVLIAVMKRFATRKRAHGNVKFFYRLINAVIISIAVLIVLMTIRPLQTFSRTLLAGSGLLAVVIGIAAQAALGNVFSGISIGISRPFVIGETIEVIGEDIVGTVTEISLRQTVIRDLNNKFIAVPNSVLDKAIVRTVQRGQAGILNYLTVTVAYGSDVDLAMALMREAALAHKDFHDIRSKKEISDGKPLEVLVAITDLGQTGVALRASVWSKDVGTGFRMLSDLRGELLRRFAAEGIELPAVVMPVP